MEQDALIYKNFESKISKLDWRKKKYKKMEFIGQALSRWGKHMVELNIGDVIKNNSNRAGEHLTKSCSVSV